MAKYKFETIGQMLKCKFLSIMNCYSNKIENNHDNLNLDINEFKKTMDYLKDK